MSIAVIRQQMQQVLKATEGINAAFAYPPDGIGSLPCGFCALNDEAISYTAGLKFVDHTLNVVVLIERTAGRLPSNLAALETLQAAFEVAMENDADLDGTVGIALLSRIQQETVTVGQTPYLAFIATLAINEQIELSLGSVE